MASESTYRRMAVVPASCGWLLCVIAAAACQDPAPRPDGQGDDEDVAPISRILRDRCDADVAPIPRGVALALVGEPYAENEVHDCQRLVVADTFGPLVGIFPVQEALAQPESAFGEWTGVASVLSWDDGYSPLHVAQNGNCLFLRSVDRTWQARLDAGGLCLGRSLPRTEAPNLDVVAARYTGPDTAETDRPIYPLTARWGWRSAAPHHYIGIKCGDRWCSIGPGMSPADTLITGPLHDSMPGYSDVQPMPIRRGNRLIVGPVVRIQPSDSLRIARSATTSMIRYVTLANVVFDTAGVASQDRRPIVLGLNLGGRRQADDHCDHLPHPASLGTCVGVDVANEVAVARRWGSVGQTHHLDFGMVTQEEHSAPGTVRWRWREPAETARESVRGGGAAADSARAAAGTLGAAAWIPCQGNNCCTAVW